MTPNRRDQNNKAPPRDSAGGGDGAGTARKLPMLGAGQTSRRDFLSGGVKTFAWGAVSLACIPMAVHAKDGDESETTEVLYGFLVDTTKCIGCCNCVVADKLENGVPDHQFRTWVERYVYRKDGSVQVDCNTEPPYAFANLPDVDKDSVDKAFFVPKLCNHCVSTPCIQVCPVGASYQTPEGVVLVDQETCIGCGYCVEACPFDTRFMHAEKHVADKCTWCYHRIKKGQLPACVEACPTEARIFGNIADPTSEISKVIATHRIDVLKSYLGTRPKTRYIGLTSEVI